MLSADAAGVMEMPVKLLIASVLMAAIIPIFYGAYEDLSVSRTEEGLLREIDDFLRISRTLLDGGEGGRICFSFDVDGSMNTGTVEVVIGGPIDGDERWRSFTVGYRISGGGFRYVVSRPPIQITGGHDGIVLGEGSHELIIEHAVMNGTHVVLIRT
jgi:hypothetical protein